MATELKIQLQLIRSVLHSDKIRALDGLLFFPEMYCSTAKVDLRGADKNGQDEHGHLDLPNQMGKEGNWLSIPCSNSSNSWTLARRNPVRSVPWPSETTVRCSRWASSTPTG